MSLQGRVAIKYARHVVRKTLSSVSSRTTTAVVALFLSLTTPLASLALSRKSLYVLRLPAFLSLWVLMLLHLQLLTTPSLERTASCFSFWGLFFRKPLPLALAEDYKRRREEREI